MYSMWTAPSDRDYYDPHGLDEQPDDDEPPCSCGAQYGEACEEWCDTRLPAEQSAEEQEMRET